MDPTTGGGDNKENVSPPLAVLQPHAAAKSDGGDRLPPESALYFSVFGKLRGGGGKHAKGRPHFVFECEKQNQHLRSHNRVDILSFHDGPAAVLAARYVRQETFCEHFTVRNALETPASRKTVSNFDSELRGQLRVFLAAPVAPDLGGPEKAADAGRPSRGGAREQDVLVLITAAQEALTFTLTFCPKKTFDTWMAVLTKNKLYLAIDLDRTVIDSYTLEGLEKVLREEAFSEREKSYILAHALALEHYNRKGEIPPFMRMIYGAANVKQEFDAVYVERERGSQLIFTKYPKGLNRKYPEGGPVLFWVRPGFDTFLKNVRNRYFSTFITHSSNAHASLALKLLKIDVAESERLSGIPVMTVCRKGKKLLTKAFHLTGAGAEKCFVGLDDLCDGSDEQACNPDGVSTWISSDLRVVVKPVPYHAYRSEAGQSDAVPLEMCANLLACIHERFFAALRRAAEDCDGSFEKLLACPLPKIDDIVSYQARNNTTSSQRMASFIEMVIQKFNSGSA